MTLRLRIAFKSNPVFSYSKTFIFGMLGFIMCTFVVFVIGMKPTINGVWLSDPHQWCHAHLKPGWRPEFYMTLFGVCYLILYVTLSLLFVLPLKELISRTEFNSSGDEFETKRSAMIGSRLGHLIVRYNILNGWIVLSSLISLMVYQLSHISTMLEFDLLISGICVWLLSATNRPAYDFLCGKCHGLTQDLWRFSSKKERVLSATKIRNTTSLKLVKSPDLEYPDAELPLKASAKQSVELR
jgi:hypothetical protein